MPISKKALLTGLSISGEILASQYELIMQGTFVGRATSFY